MTSITEIINYGNIETRLERDLAQSVIKQNIKIFVTNFMLKMNRMKKLGQTIKGLKENFKVNRKI